MGVIQRQATKNSVVNWLGTLFGLLNIFFIVPLALEAYGLFTFIFATASLIVPFAALGFSNIIIKFFPVFSSLSSKSKSSFFSFILLFPTAVFIVVWLLIILFRGPIYEHYQESSPEYVDYLIVILPLSFLLLMINLTTTFTSNFGRIVVPGIFKQSIKVTLPILLLCLFQEWINLNQFVWLIILQYVIQLVLNFFYLKHLGELKFSFDFSIFTKPRVREMANYGFYVFLTGLGFILLQQVDVFMVGTFLEIGTKTAIYSAASITCNIIMVPFYALIAISNPIISRLSNEKKREEIGELYQKSSLNLSIIAIFIFTGIYSCSELFFGMLGDGNKFDGISELILVLGLGKVMAVSSGVGGAILSLSEHYRHSLYAILVLSVVNIIGNYFLIIEFDLVGAAISSAISIILYNIYIIVINWWKFRIFPFQLKTLVPLMLGLIIYYISSFIAVESALISVILRVIFISISFVGSILIFGISSDFSSTFYKYWRMLKFW